MPLEADRGCSEAVGAYRGSLIGGGCHIDVGGLGCENDAVDAAGVFIMKNFFESIPVAVEEAARIDGAGTFRTFWSIVLPMARPALMTIVILSFQGSWNELNHFIVSTQSPGLVTLTRGVASLASGQLSSGNQYPIMLAAATLMTIPVAVIFFVFQKRIMHSAGGAVKD